MNKKKFLLSHSFIEALHVDADEDYKLGLMDINQVYSESRSDSVYTSSFAVVDQISLGNISKKKWIKETARKVVTLFFSFISK